MTDPSDPRSSMRTPRARHAVADDLPVLERTLSLAFADDPMVTWVSGLDADHLRDRRIDDMAVAFFRPSLAAALQRGHTYTVDGCGAAALWSAPDARIFTDEEGTGLAMAIAERLGEGAMHRLVALGELVGRHHPSGVPHFYLFLLGAADQGHGLGAAVIRPVLDRCDLDGMPAYLESSSERNLSFYERHGFRVLWEDRPAADGPVFHGLWRDPR